MLNIEKSSKEMKQFEKETPRSVNLKMRWHLETQYLHFCREAATWMLKSKGCKNPPAELLDAAAERLYADGFFINEDAGLSVMDEVIKEYNEGEL